MKSTERSWQIGPSKVQGPKSTPTRNRGASGECKGASARAPREQVGETPTWTRGTRVLPGDYGAAGALGRFHAGRLHAAIVALGALIRAS
jgi:hypothetical protein